MDNPRIKIGCEVFLKQGDTYFLANERTVMEKVRGLCLGGHLDPSSPMAMSDMIRRNTD